MGEDRSQDKAALLPKSTDGDASATGQVRALEEGANEWRGPLLACCSGCDSNAWGSCLLGYFVPCYAFGLNMKHALNLSVVAQAVLYAVLFFAGKYAYAWSAQAVSVACPKPLPEMDNHRMHSSTENTLQYGFALKYTAGSKLPGSFDFYETNDAGKGHLHAYPSQSSQECNQALAALGATYTLMSICIICGIVYAARRRTQIREKFSIAGSHFGDLCAWFWCGPCALCQETRTLWSNNVRNGVWYGQTPSASIPASAYTVPAVEDMKAEYKPVVAKDFV